METTAGTDDREAVRPADGTEKRPKGTKLLKNQPGQKQNLKREDWVPISGEFVNRF